MKRSKLTTIIVIVVTFLLAGVAIFTAIRLWQLRTQPVAPNVPESEPVAGGVTPTPQATAAVCALNFTLVTPTPSPTPTPVPQCNTVCSSSSQCPAGLTCYKPSGATTGNCRNASCTSATNCVCVTPTPTPTKTPSPTPTPTKTPTPTPVPQCNAGCTSDNQCPSGLTCYIPNGQTSGNCRNSSCTSATNCMCPTPTPTTPGQTPGPTDEPTNPPIAKVPPTVAPQLPDSGTSWPTLFGLGLGVLIILGSLLLAI